MGVSYQMSVEYSQFKTGMQQAQASVKTMDAALKANEAQFKATGDAEVYMENKAKSLEQKMRAQKSVYQQAEAALKAMKEHGVDPLDVSYQKMQQTMLNAQAGISDTMAELNGLTSAEQVAATGADKLSGSVSDIGKKLSLDQVITGIGKITSAMENAAKVAVNLGKAIWDNITDSASWADSTATAATVLGMDVEEYQKYQKVFDTVAEITVADWRKAKQKVQSVIFSPTDSQVDVLKALGISRYSVEADKNGTLEPVLKDFESLFWEIGETLQRKVASGELTGDLADSYANAIFGRSFGNLNHIFKMGQEAFQEEVDKQVVTSQEAIDNLAKMNDTIIGLQGDFATLKNDVLAGLAPALTTAAEALDSLLKRIMEYLQTPEGQQALQDMGTAVSGLFDDLGKIDPDSVVEGFTKVFNTVVGSLKWLDENKESLKDALTVIVTGWGAAKLVNGALEVKKLIDGIHGLTSAGSAGATAGAAWGTSFATAASTAVKAVAPWLATILGVTALAVTPAVAAQKADEERWKNKQNQRIKAADDIAAVVGENENTKFVRNAAEAVGPKRRADGSYDTDVTGYFLNMNPTDAVDDLLMGLRERRNQQQAELFTAIELYAKETEGHYTANLLQDYWNGAELDPYVVNAMLQNITDALAEYENNKVKIPAVLELTEEPEETVQKATGKPNRRNTVKIGALMDAGDARTPQMTYAIGISAVLGGLGGAGGKAEGIDAVLDALGGKGAPGDGIPVSIVPKAEENAAEDIAKQVGLVTIAAKVVPITAGGQMGMTKTGWASGGGGSSPMMYIKEHANGLPFVPGDGYLAILHRGERVMTAQENRSYTYNNHNYFGNVNLNNGLEIDNLVDSINRRNRATRKGYGS